MKTLKDTCRWRAPLLEGSFRGHTIDIIQAITGRFYEWRVFYGKWVVERGVAPNQKAAKVASLRAVAKLTSTRYAGVR